MLRGKLIAFDTETTGLNPWLGDRPFAVSMCNEFGETLWWEWPVDPFTRKPQYVKADLEEIRTILEDESSQKIAHNLKFDARMLEMVGIRVAGPMHCTHIGAHVCGLSAGFRKLKLKPMCERYIDFPADDEKDLQQMVVRCRRVAKKLGWKIHPKETNADYWLPYTLQKLRPDLAKSERINPAVCEKYGTQDSVRAMLFFHWLQTRMEELQVQGVYAREMGLWPATYGQESRGVYVNMGRVGEGIRKATKIHKKAIRRFDSLGVNIGSPKQLQKYLFEDLGLDPISYTKNGAPSTQADDLEAYAESHPEAREILEARRSKKLLDYLTTFQRMAVEEQYTDPQGNHRTIHVIHCNINQVGPITGRESITVPALQTVPNPKKSPGILAQARLPLGPRPGRRWYCFDYSQIEARVFADVFEEETMLAAFYGGHDVYQELAVAVNKRAFGGRETVNRDQSKAIFLGKLYGLGAKNLAYRLGVDLEMAYTILDAFDSTFPKVANAMESIIDLVQGRGYIRTIGGRYVEVDADFPYRGVNYTIQGSAADLLKMAMIRVHKFLQRTKADAAIILPVHDEIIVEAGPSCWKRSWVLGVKKIIEDNEGMFKVPTVCKVERVVDSWFDQKKIEWAS